jgi:general secretion pathway protein J
MMPEDRSEGRRGFTLIEVLIALSLIALVTFFLYETYVSTSRVTEKINGEREDYREIRLTFDQMTRELMSAYQSYSPASTPLLFTGVHDTGENGSIDTLSFYAMSHLHLIEDQPDTDLTRVTYTLEKPADARWYELMHEEYPHFLSDGPAEKEVLMEQVKEARFQYYDGTKWLNEWNNGKSPTTAIPAAVKITLVVVHTDGTPEEWSRQINLLPLSPQ